ncbi:fasciclin domain-containing protein [Streptomyces sclerotialus]|uniref:fasciclin domain-containing protein n=1 Tax=Streptomyces sclerotialus TaxID=1957 RepID=UPI0004C70853
MNTTAVRRAALALTAAVALPLSLAACAGEDGGTSQPASGSSSAPEKSGTGGGTNAMSGPFGPACSSVPKDGKGSFDGMAADPVATAASHNPALSTLVTAVRKAGLVDTLNNAENITVFAPTNDAFDKIPKAQLDKVLDDKEMLTQILTYHVVGRQLTPAQLENGSYPTLQKSRLTTSGSGTDYTVNDSSKVVCGNVPTANATVHLVDSVLMPEL